METSQELELTIEHGSQPLASFVHPYDWPQWMKWVNTMIEAYHDFLTTFVSMMLAPSVPQILAEFRPDGRSRFLGTFCVTIYILGFAFGPLFLGPLSDLYGRAVVLRTALLLYLAMTIGCALSTGLGMLLAFRFLAGMFGGAPLAIGGAVVSDMYPSGAKGRPMASFNLGLMLGPTLGPVIGGIVNGTLGWRWIFWLASIMTGICVFSVFFAFRESHVPTLRRRHTKRLARSLEQPDKEKEAKQRKSRRDPVAKLSHVMLMPARLVFCHLSIALIVLDTGVQNGVVNMILSSLGSVYQLNYHFPPITAGLAYLGIGLGGISASFTANYINSILCRWRGFRCMTGAPERILPLALLSHPLSAIGALWYGWATQGKAHWFVPIPGLFLFGCAWLNIRLATQVYLVEAVPQFSASALAAHTVAHSLGGAFIPLSTWPMYEKIGYGWGNSVIALISLLLGAIPLYLILRARRREGSIEP